MSKICQNCGAPCPDQESLCANCGAKLPESQAWQQSAAGTDQNQQNAYGQAPYGQNQQNAYGQAPYGQNQQNPYGQAPQNPYGGSHGGAGYGMAPGLGMGWYKFVIYFQLFASALINGIAGIVALTGAHYEGEADLVYTFIPSLSTVDKLYGIVLIALAVFAIIVRFQLAQFKKTGPKFYLLLLLISGIASLIYLIAAGAIVSDFGIEIEYSSQISQLIVSAALLVANYIYFQKRSNLFVN